MVVNVLNLCAVTLFRTQNVSQLLHNSCPSTTVLWQWLGLSEWLIKIGLQSRFEMLQFANRKACDVDAIWLRSRANAWLPALSDRLTNQLSEGSAPPFSPISTALANCVNAHHKKTKTNRKREREWDYGVYRVRLIVGQINIKEKRM